MLYDSLVLHHRITDLRRFSAESFAKLFTIKGVFLLLALNENKIVGAQILMQDGSIIYAHLAAFTPEGYRLGASYLLDDLTIRISVNKFEYVNWGGAHGLHGSDRSGLAFYKRGWATDFRTSYIVGCVLNDEIYENLSVRQYEESDYFPLYRKGEFNLLRSNPVTLQAAV